jgi:hypothetical protein
LSQHWIAQRPLIHIVFIDRIRVGGGLLGRRRSGVGLNGFSRGRRFRSGLWGLRERRRAPDESRQGEGPKRGKQCA